MTVFKLSNVNLLKIIKR